MYWHQGPKTTESRDEKKNKRWRERWQENYITVRFKRWMKVKSIWWKVMEWGREMDGCINEIKGEVDGGRGGLKDWKRRKVIFSVLLCLTWKGTTTKKKSNVMEIYSQRFILNLKGSSHHADKSIRHSRDFHLWIKDFSDFLHIKFLLKRVKTSVALFVQITRVSPFWLASKHEASHWSSALFVDIFMCTWLILMKVK